MFSHVTLGSNNVVKAAVFYDKVLPILGWQKGEANPEMGYSGYKTADEYGPQFWIVTPYNKQAATAGNGVTIGFNVPTRKQVDDFYAAVLANGGSDEGAPGVREHYHPDYYGCYVRDLDGNKLCCVCHLPQ